MTFLLLALLVLGLISTFAETPRPQPGSVVNRRKPTRGGP